MITFEVANAPAHHSVIEVPEGINLNLMEVLRASDYAIEATCGGMALCATCQVEVIKGIEQLGGRTEAELDMLDTLPSSTSRSRLACQIPVDEKLQGTVFQLKVPA
jgi:ferredoxin